jgi:hypothetical protein
VNQALISSSLGSPCRIFTRTERPGPASSIGTALRSTSIVPSRGGHAPLSGRNRTSWRACSPRDAAPFTRRDAGSFLSVITPNSPVGRAILGKRKGDSVEIAVAGEARDLSVTFVC